MKNQYAHQLDRSSRKFSCPSCSQNAFVKMRNTSSKEYLDPEFGRCDRELNCGYQKYPKGMGELVECYYAPDLRLREYSEASYIMIYGDQQVGFIPKSQVYDDSDDRCFLSAFICDKNDNIRDVSDLEIRWYNKYTRQLDKIEDRKGRVLIAPKAIIPNEVLEETFENLHNNVFLNNLKFNVKFPFPKHMVDEVQKLYQIGTVNDGQRMGAVTFPYINLKGEVVAIQERQYDSNNHGVKSAFSNNFIHKRKERWYKENNQQFPDWLKEYLEHQENGGTIIRCLFGEHLLAEYPLSPVAIVEAPKTAIYASLYFGLPTDPSQFIWLSSFNLSSLTLDKCRRLTGRQVVLFPDLSNNSHAYKKWNEKAEGLNNKVKGATFSVSDFLEENASVSDRSNGLDLADYLEKIDWRIFRNVKDEKMQ